MGRHTSFSAQCLFPSARPNHEVIARAGYYAPVKRGPLLGLIDARSYFYARLRVDPRADTLALAPPLNRGPIRQDRPQRLPELHAGA